MKLTPLEDRITNIVAPVIEDEGFTLYCVQMTSENKTQILQIMAEDPKTGRLGVDDCAKISRAVAAVLDVEDPISGAYRLEVSSPGIDRLLLKKEHFEKYKGFEAKLESDIPSETGQKKFRGRLHGVNENAVSLITDQGEEVDIPLQSLKKAKLVLNDELIKATANL